MTCALGRARPWTGPRDTGQGPRILDPGSWIQDPGSRIRDQGSWFHDPGSRILTPKLASSRNSAPAALAARAVDREFEFGGRGAAPPRTPLLSGGLRPPDPPKGAPRPWLQRLFAFSRPNPLSGAELFPRIPTFIFEQATCPGQLRCLGQSSFSKTVLFFF